MYRLPQPMPPLAVARFRCYNACQHMADWKQITARIRRARTGKDPVGQLSNLFEKTRDAMVAFELARYFETAGQNPEAAKWYLAAADRFRRADWKTKAQEAAVRLGAEIPPADAISIVRRFSADFSFHCRSSSPSLFDAESAAAAEFLQSLLLGNPKQKMPPSKHGSESAESPDKKRRRRGTPGWPQSS